MADKALQEYAEDELSLDGVMVGETDESGANIRGVIATQDLRVDKVIFRVKPEQLICPENSVLEEAPTESWSDLILSLMLEYTNSGSPHRRYLDALPKTLDMPIFWSKDELEWLKGTDLDGAAGRSNAAITEQYETVIEPFCREHPEWFDERHDFELFKWCGAIISSYAFSLDDGRTVLVPFADALNHKTLCNNARLFVEEDALEMTVIKTIKRGEEVYNTYGLDLPNSTLLQKYGFVDAVNPFSAVTFSLADVIRAVNVDAEVVEERISAVATVLQMLAGEEEEEEEPVLGEEDWENVKFPVTSQGVIGEGLDAAMRVLLFSPSEFAAFLSGDLDSGGPIREHRSLHRAMLSLVDRRLSLYSCGPLEGSEVELCRVDAAFRKGEREAFRRRCALTLAVGEQRVLGKVKRRLRCKRGRG